MICCFIFKSDPSGALFERQLQVWQPRITSRWLYKKGRKRRCTRFFSRTYFNLITHSRCCPVEFMLFAQGHLENRRWGIRRHYPFGFPTHIIQQQLFSKVISPLNSFSFDSFLSLNRQMHVYFSRFINHETETQTNWFLLPEEMIEVWGVPRSYWLKEERTIK